jgi:hypothetical protein
MTFYGDCVKMCEDFAPNFGEKTGCCITRMHRLTLSFSRGIFSYTKNNVTVVPHPPYSPDLALCDFYLFPQLKMKLKGRRFDTIEVIEAEVQAMLYILIEHDFQDAFKNGRSTGNDVYMQKGTTSRVMEASRLKVSSRPDGCTSPGNYGYQ